MNCPTCGNPDTRVVETDDQGVRVRRRRACSRGHRFTTHEQTQADDEAVAARVRRKLLDLADALDELRLIVGDRHIWGVKKS